MGVHRQRECFLLEGPLVSGLAANNERHIQDHALAPSMYPFYLRTFQILFEHPAVPRSKTSCRSAKERDPFLPRYGGAATIRPNGNRYR